MLAHTSNAILLVHDFVKKLLAHLCPELQTRDQLWDGILVDKLCEGYRSAMRHARFLLDVERNGRPSTFNHYFNSNVQKQRSDEITKLMAPYQSTFPGSSEPYVALSKLNRAVTDMSNADQTCIDITNTLASYYKVSRKRFVDCVCAQVVNHFLLDSPGSPVKSFTAELVMGLSEDQLDQIAGEDASSRRRRQALGQEIQSLEAATKVIRG